MALQSLDQVSKGDWLLCEEGPAIIRYPISEDLGIPLDPIHTTDKTFVGCIMKVLAVNIPIILCDVYLVKEKKSYRGTYPFHWATMKWGKANKTYVRNYLKMFRKLVPK